MLVINNLYAGYRSQIILKNFSLTFSTGKVTSIIGANGSGKSTLLRAIYGLINIKSGQIMYNGVDLLPLSIIRKVSCGIMYLPQDNKIFAKLTVLQNIRLFTFHKHSSIINDLVDQLICKIPLLKNIIHEKVFRLSLGEQQIVAFTRCLINDYNLLLLDEPTTGLDGVYSEMIFNHIQEINKNTKCTILIVEQKVKDVLRISDHYCALKEGQLYDSGDKCELINNPENLKNIFHNT